MKAVILVGGFGTRLRPLTLHTPKQMLPIVDRPMIEHVAAKLGEYGVTEAILSLGYKPDAFFEAYPDNVCAGVRLHYAIEAEPLDTAGAIRFAATEGGIDSTFIVVNGDVLTDLDVTALWDFHHGCGAQATIALTPVDDPSRYGVVPIDSAGKVLDFVEKPPRGEEPTNWINAGTYVLEPSVLEQIAGDRRVSIERETFPELVAGGTLYAVQSDAYWIDAGTPETYLQAQLDLVDGRRGAMGRAVSPDAEIDLNTDVEHSIVMAGAAIEDGAIVHDSVLLPGAAVGQGAAVENSIVGPAAVIGAHAEVTAMSVIGAGVIVPDGAVVDAMRIPEGDV